MDKQQLMAALAAEAKVIDKTIEHDIDRLQGKVDPLLPEVLRYGLLQGGKRVRPLLVVLAARLCGCKDNAVYTLASAFEYLHAATLFHDDVIDNAETRRGNPSVYKKYGLISAILAGDFLHARSMEIVGQLAGDDGLHVFCGATAGMVDGEFMQLRNASQLNLSEVDYYEAIMGKTGLLIAASCEVGAIFGGATPEQRRALREYGVGLGCAFQMVDDLLDYNGDKQKTGKAVGNDLSEGKMTLPLIMALSRAERADKLELERVIAVPELREVEFSKVHGLIEKYNGFAETRRRAQDAVGRAVNELEIFTGPAVAGEKAVLAGLAHYVLSRDK